MADKWLLKNPHTLPMIITLNNTGTVTAAFPALGIECRVTVWDADPWKARDKAILACAEQIVKRMKEGGQDGPDDIERTA